MTRYGERFSQRLQAESASAQALLACLEEEHAALRQPGPELLEAVVRRKIELLQEMTQYAIERSELLAAAGFSSEGAAIDAFIQQQAPAAEQPWRELLATTARLEQQNRINGAMIQLSQQRTQMALDLITRPSGAKTYGKQGYAAPDPTCYTSVKA